MSVSNTVKLEGPVTLRNFLSNLSRNAPQQKREVCPCALVKTDVKLREIVAGGVIHCAMVLPVATICCEKKS